MVQTLPFIKINKYSEKYIYVYKKNKSSKIGSSIEKDNKKNEIPFLGRTDEMRRKKQQKEMERDEQVGLP